MDYRSTDEGPSNCRSNKWPINAYPININVPGPIPQHTADGSLLSWELMVIVLFLPTFYGEQQITSPTTGIFEVTGVQIQIQIQSIRSSHQRNRTRNWLGKKEFGYEKLDVQDLIGKKLPLLTKRTWKRINRRSVHRRNEWPWQDEMINKSISFFPSEFFLLGEAMMTDWSTQGPYKVTRKDKTGKIGRWNWLINNRINSHDYSLFTD